MRETKRAIGNALDFMAIIAVNASGRDAPNSSEIIFVGSRRVARGADAGAVGILREQPPADVRLAVPIRPLVEASKMLAIDRMGVAAARPFTVDLRMAIAAIVDLIRVGSGVNPLVIHIVLGGQT
jgi:hypothetical protein